MPRGRDWQLLEVQEDDKLHLVNAAEGGPYT